MVGRTLISCAVLLCACTPPPGTEDGGSKTCPAFDKVSSATVLTTGLAHSVPLSWVVRGETRFCVDAHTFGLSRMDAVGRGKVTLEADGGMSIQADVGGVYALVDEAAPQDRISKPLYFARNAKSPLLSWPRFCEEVHRLTDTVWACDGALFNGAVPLTEDGTLRWMRRLDGTLLAARSNGVYGVNAAQLGSDSGTLLSAVVEIEGWDNDSTGLSVATDSGFAECLWGQTSCSSLGPRFGTGDVPLAQQSLVALMRRDGKTVFSVSPAQKPYCEAKPTVQQCASLLLGPIIAAKGSGAWGLSTFFTEGTGLSVVPLEWDAGWTVASGGFAGPPAFVVQGGVRAQTPSRVIYSRDRQFLFWRWDATGEAFDLVEVPDAGPPQPLAGAADGFYWVSVGGPLPTTRVFADE